MSSFSIESHQLTIRASSEDLGRSVSDVVERTVSQSKDTHESPPAPQHAERRELVRGQVLVPLALQKIPLFGCMLSEANQVLPMGVSNLRSSHGRRCPWRASWTPPRTRVRWRRASPNAQIRFHTVNSEVHVFVAVVQGLPAGHLQRSVWHCDVWELPLHWAHLPYPVHLLQAVLYPEGVDQLRKRRPFSQTNSTLSCTNWQRAECDGRTSKRDCPSMGHCWPDLRSAGVLASASGLWDQATDTDTNFSATSPM